MSHSLVPFSRSTAPAIAINCQVAVSDLTLCLDYTVTGAVQAVEFATPTQSPQRQDELWRRTCFEWFLAPSPSQTRYWEFNLSPAHHWNIYRFSDYRVGMAPETTWGRSPIVVNHQAQQSDTYHLGIEIDLSLILTRLTGAKLGIAVVIASPKQGISYWALTHPAAQADFHQRQSWFIELV